MLTGRQGRILASIVKEYTTTATPVSSSLIAEKHHPEYSSATIRSIMHELEESGYILKPHISAGRIPSDSGYRYFVDKLLRTRSLSEHDRKMIQVELLHTRAHNLRLSKVLAKLLSTTSRCMAISGMIDRREYHDFGMHTLLGDPEFDRLDEMSKLSAALDLIDERVDELLENIGRDETKIFIGKENPIREIRKCSMIVSPYRFKSGEQGLLAIIGPKRMKYDRNKNLIDFLKKFLRGKSLFLMVIAQGWHTNFLN